MTLVNSGLLVFIGQNDYLSESNASRVWYLNHVSSSGVQTKYDCKMLKGGHLCAACILQRICNLQIVLTPDQTKQTMEFFVTFQNGKVEEFLYLLNLETICSQSIMREHSLCIMT